MKVIDFFDSENQSHWLSKIEKCYNLSPEFSGLWYSYKLGFICAFPSGEGGTRENYLNI